MSSDYQTGVAPDQSYTTALTNLLDDTQYIPSLESSVSLADFSASGGSYVNRWGYSLNNSTYNPIPAHNTTDQIKSSTTAANKELVPVYVAANVNTAKSTGTYRNNLTFSAIANPISTVYELHYLPGTTDTVTNLPSDTTVSEVSAQHTFTIPSIAPSRTGYDFTGYLDEDTSTTYQPGDTITLISDEDYEVSATLTAQWSIASYTVNISNSNTSTNPASSVSIPYGGSAQVTVTPNTGYYLNSVSCPSGYTCTGFTTGTSATGQQTVTVVNNGTVSGGTLGFTGTVDTRTLAQKCSDASTGSTFTHSSVEYIKLKTSSDGSTTACYTNTNRGVATFANAASLCPTGTGVPTQGEFQSLINVYGADGTLYSTTGWRNSHWSSTPSGSSSAYFLHVASSGASIQIVSRTTSNYVVCIVR
ncbi:hypothetical protein IKW75_01990 [Candidatus Saccharibacteria bacterium]|nr:hypothetical protein [Candidatus Saccharibacteria bacterium]